VARAKLHANNGDLHQGRGNADSDRDDAPVELHQRTEVYPVRTSQGGAATRAVEQPPHPPSPQQVGARMKTMEQLDWKTFILQGKQADA